jgi:hypothetical protein
MVSTKINLSVAVAAITIKGWLPTVDEISAAAALWIPILGFVLLVLQIVKLLWDWVRKPKQ